MSEMNNNVGVNIGTYLVYPNIIQKTKEELLETKTIIKTNQD